MSFEEMCGCSHGAFLFLGYSPHQHPPHLQRPSQLMHPSRCLPGPPWAIPETLSSQRGRPYSIICILLGRQLTLSA
jgi:hypothetical protein